MSHLVVPIDCCSLSFGILFLDWKKVKRHDEYDVLYFNVYFLIRFYDKNHPSDFIYMYIYIYIVLSTVSYICVVLLKRRLISVRS